MSAPCFGWAVDEGRRRMLTPSERHVLLILSNRANGSLVCWPSLTTIADDSGLSPRTVHTAVHGLERQGLLTIKRRGRSMEYHILRANGAAEPSQLLQQSDAENDHEPSQPLQQLQPLQYLQPPNEAEPSQPLQDDSCKIAHLPLATIATESTKKNLPRNLRRAHAREAKIVSQSDSKASKARSDLQTQLAKADMGADERANVAAFLRAVKGDIPRPELTTRLSFIRQKYSLIGFPWLIGHEPVALEIAEAEEWSHPAFLAQPAPLRAEARGVSEC